jgi:RHS repeat-associated protein
VTEYTWDYRNRLASVTERAGGVRTAATKVVEYKYDLSQRLVGKTLDPDGEGEEEASEEYYAYDQTPFSTRENASQMLFRFEGSEVSDLKSRYLWAPVVDLLLSDEKLTGPTTPGDVYWALGDNLNTVRDIARYDPQTDTTTIVNHRTFDAFGNITSESNSAVDLIFSFTGRLFDESTGLQNNLHRWYDPTVGRWLSEDPIGFAPDANPYRYVANRPTYAMDPTGLFSYYTSNMNATQVATLKRVEAEALRRMRLWSQFLSTISRPQIEEHLAGLGYPYGNVLTKRPNNLTIAAFTNDVGGNTDRIVQALATSSYTLKTSTGMPEYIFAETVWSSGGARLLPGDSGGKGVDHIRFNVPKFFKASPDKQVGVFCDEMSHYACRTSQASNWIQPSEDIRASARVDRLYWEMGEKGKDPTSIRNIYWAWINSSVSNARSGGGVPAGQD